VAGPPAAEPGDLTPQPPAGFAVHDRTSPFLDVIGPLYSRTTDAGLELALVIDERHANRRGDAHGGVLATLADVALGYATSATQDPPTGLTTTSLSIDYAGAVRTGDTVIATVEVQHIGRRVAFANCYLHCDGRRVVRASAVFAKPPDAPPAG
jgi:acyl-coenzyme A thioesterase 13